MSHRSDAGKTPSRSFRIFDKLWPPNDDPLFGRFASNDTFIGDLEMTTLAWNTVFGNGSRSVGEYFDFGYLIYPLLK